MGKGEGAEFLYQICLKRTALNIKLQLDVVGLRINKQGKLCLVIVFEKERWELEVIGMDVNKEWILSNGRNRNTDRRIG